ncbi:TPA: hypothetical protein ACH3X1_009498 [Trebouxia sp. C0004]
MYIYRALEDGSRVTEAESLHLQDDSRVIQLEGHPANVIGIRFKPQSSSRSKQPTQHKEGQLADENKREAKNAWKSFKEDPLQPLSTYWNAYAMPGMGLFLEGYVVWTEATQYLQLIGVLLGQFIFGVLGDWIGRKATMLIDMSVIIVGLIMLTVSNGPSINGWVIMYAFAQLIFGFGIGGEYPMTSVTATEASEEDRQYGQQHRGRKGMLAYTMQGWGQFVNLSLLLMFLNIFNHGGKGPYGGGSAGATWRVSFAVLIPVAIYLLYYRVYVLKELKLLDQVKQRSGVKGYDWKSVRLLFTHFWHRLLGTCGIWFCNDWYFYGNGVFRSTIVELLVGSSASVQINWLYQLINAGVQLVGYYGAALTVDYRCIGRRRLTVISFTMVALCYASVAGAYERLTDPEHKKNLHVFQFLFYLSAFFALFGSHTTSFLLSAELYPAAVRSTAHGISAASGKLGSILSVVWLNYLRSRNKFWITWPMAAFGAVICYVFIADNTGLDLAEQERRWFFIRNGNPADYHGPAVHWRHLSRWERYVCKVHKQYDPVLDAKQRREAHRHHLSPNEEAKAFKEDMLSTE